MKTAQEMEYLTRKLIEQGHLHKAAEACDRMNQQYPEYSSGWYTSSHLAMLVNEPMLAVSAIDRALQLSPGKPEWLFKRVEYLIAMGDREAAKATAAQLSGHLFASIEICIAVAGTLGHLGMFKEARLHLRHATQLTPNDPVLFYNLAAVERSLGNSDAAHAAATRCIELQPDHAEAYLLRAGVLTHTPEKNNIDSLLQAFERADGDVRRRVKLCYALAKEFEDIGDYERSFDYLSKGASIRRATMQYEAQKDLEAMQNIRRVYSADLFGGEVEGYVNAEPIFVIGLPRTGTVLVDRILSIHPVVFSAGELPTFSAELVNHCQRASGGKVESSVELVQTSVEVDFAALGEDYVAATRPATGRTPHFVDKLPQNFLYAGPIHLALPKAKIVLLDRHPMDTCFAVYKNLFEGAYPFSYQLEELANYYVAYRELVDHWRSVMPGVIHVVNYEDLVKEPKPVVQDLLEYCGLSWDESCLDFFAGLHADADVAAARRDFFRSSVGAWQKFEKQLRPVSDIIGDYL